MRKTNRTHALLPVAGFLLITLSPIQAQSPQGDRPGQPERGRDRPRGIVFPPPPVLSALDADKDGEISAEEMTQASDALKTLDKNGDGELSDTELAPSFDTRDRRGPGGFGGFRGGSPNTVQLAPEDVDFRDGAAAIPDLATFHKLAYKGNEVMIDTFLADLEFVKFTLDKPATDEQQLYFQNTKTHRAHMMFARAAGLPFGRGGGQMKGVLVYRPMLESPSGQPGLFTFEFEPFDAYSVERVLVAEESLTEKMPILKGNIGYYPRGERALAQFERDKGIYEILGIKVYLDEDLNNTDIGYLPLNLGESFGRLRLMELEDRPSPRDIVLYRSLPNEMPRVAGIITTVRQTTLSHVNLRAVQDKIPNAFITEAAQNPTIQPLIGRFVAYKVTADGYEIREATSDEVDGHFAKLRPDKKQIPRRDLTVTKIRSLGDITFEDSTSVGVKGANVATLRTFGFPTGTIPNGHAVPFFFYDEFMKHNGFYQRAAELLADPTFQQNRETQEAELKQLRKQITKGTMPDWMMSALDDLHRSFPEGTPIRCRSSTNNEDLPGFSGAGLYDSFTHHPVEGHLSKSIKQVYASLWNFRAFEERDFYRVDHFTTAMGVLVHPNFEEELANGVAVTDDILYQTEGNYYLNTQVGEDLVTNPEAASIPEELLLDWWNSRNVQVMRTSNRATAGDHILSNDSLEQLRDHLGKIHAKFARLYGKRLDQENFAMEIEFKITSKGRLAIKQARPWVYAPVK